MFLKEARFSLTSMTHMGSSLREFSSPVSILYLILFVLVFLYVIVSLKFKMEKEEGKSVGQVKQDLCTR